MMSQYGLVFCPKSLTFASEKGVELLSQLENAGFIGASFDVLKQQGYLIGDKFLKLITFLGCSPHIDISPPQNLSDWGNFCHIEINSTRNPQFFKGLKRPKCSCPHCKSRVNTMLAELEQWAPETQTLQCPKCQQTVLVEQLNWRHGGGFGQFFIVVNSIYPNEAIPTDKLMSLLSSASDEPWDYFYYERDDLS
jgi:hypothetical protein